MLFPFQDEYSPLKELILNPQLEVVVALADICHQDRLPLASSLLRIFRFEDFFWTYISALFFFYIR